MCFAAARLAALLMLAGPTSGARHQDEEKLTLDVDHSTNYSRADCDLSRYSDLKSRFKNLVFAGAGANGCVYLAQDSQQQNMKVALKVAKKAGYLKAWREECERSQDLHVRACEKGDEAVHLAERYLPVCTDVGGTDEAPFMVMHAADSNGINTARAKIPKEARKSVFSQMVGALAAMHGVGLSHNDLTDTNVVILKNSDNLVSLVDFGEVVPLNKAQYKGGYKQDENLLAREAGLLAECPKNAQFPYHKETISSQEKDARADALASCLKKAWCDQGEDCSFLQALRDVIDESYQHQHGKRPENMETTKVMDLYHTAFVQTHQPVLHQLFPALCHLKSTGRSTTLGATSPTPTTTTTTTTSGAASRHGLLGLLALALLQLIVAH